MAVACIGDGMGVAITLSVSSNNSVFPVTDVYVCAGDDAGVTRNGVFVVVMGVAVGDDMIGCRRDDVIDVAGDGGDNNELDISG